MHACRHTYTANSVSLRTPLAVLAWSGRPLHPTMSRKSRLLCCRCLHPMVPHSGRSCRFHRLLHPSFRMLACPQSCSQDNALSCARNSLVRSLACVTNYVFSRFFLSLGPCDGVASATSPDVVVWKQVLRPICFYSIRITSFARAWCVVCASRVCACVLAGTFSRAPSIHPYYGTCLLVPRPFDAEAAAAAGVTALFRVHRTSARLLQLQHHFAQMAGSGLLVLGLKKE